MITEHLLSGKFNIIDIVLIYKVKACVLNDDPPQKERLGFSLSSCKAGGVLLTCPPLTALY